MHKECVLLPGTPGAADVQRKITALQPTSTVDILQCQQHGAHEHHRGILISALHNEEHGTLIDAVVLDAATGEVLRIADPARLRPAAPQVSDSLQAWRPPAFIECLARHLVQKDACVCEQKDSKTAAEPRLAGYDGVRLHQGRWQACVEVPTRGTMVVGTDPHQLLAAWLRDEAARRAGLYFVRNIPKGIGVADIMQHLGVHSVDMSLLPTPEFVKQLHEDFAVRRAGEQAAPVAKLAGMKRGRNMDADNLLAGKQSIAGSSRQQAAGTEACHRQMLAPPAAETASLAECQGEGGNAHCSNAHAAVPAGQQATSSLMQGATGSVAETSLAAAAAAGISCSALAEQRPDKQQAPTKPGQQAITAGSSPVVAAGVGTIILKAEGMHELQQQQQQQQSGIQPQQGAQGHHVQQKEQAPLHLLPQQQQPAHHTKTVVQPRNTMQGIAYSAGQTVMLSCFGSGSAASEQLLIQVEQFTARGGHADVYQVQLLQRLLPDSGIGQLPAEAAAALAPAAPQDSELQPGQRFAIKVARSLESYPADEQGGVTPALHLRVAAEMMQQEWQVLQDMQDRQSFPIIKAYRCGRVAASAVHSLNMTPAAAAASSGERQQQGQAAAAAALPCILMAYSDGGTVWDMLYKQHGTPTPLTAREAWDVMAAAVLALQDMHAAGYIHHDLKVANMLRVYTIGDPRYMLADMGTVYKLKNFADRVPYEPLGTPQYWPPEMVEGTSHHMGYDIFSLGLLLLEMRTAQPPFRHLMKLPWEQQRLRRTYDELVQCGITDSLLPSERKLLQRCLQVDAGLRAQAYELTYTEEYFHVRPV